MIKIQNNILDFQPIMLYVRFIKKLFLCSLYINDFSCVHNNPTNFNFINVKLLKDYYCELSPLQKQLYEDFAKSRAHQTLSESVNSNQPPNTSHIFQVIFK